MSEKMSWVPKGGMCTTCDHRFNDCSGLPFQTMPVISKPVGGIHIVRCTDYFKDRKVEEEDDA